MIQAENTHKNLTTGNMHYINTLLNNSLDKQRLLYPTSFDDNVDWSVKIVEYYEPREFSYYDVSTHCHDFPHDFVNRLFCSYNLNKLDAFKDIFDYCHAEKIDLIGIIKDVYLSTSITPSAHLLAPEYFGFITYSYEKNYFSPEHDFKPYFDSFKKNGIRHVKARMHALQVLDNDLSYESYQIHCSTYEDYLNINSVFTIEEQETIKKTFAKFEEQPFFDTKNGQHLHFYPSLLKIETLSTLQEDSYFSKRFSFSADHPISTLSHMIDSNLKFIYNTVLNDLKEKDIIQDFSTLSEQGYFYLYVFTDEQKTLSHIGRSIQAFHKEIQPFLQNNNQNQFYYEKLFATMSLTQQLSHNKKNLTHIDTPQPKKSKI